MKSKLSLSNINAFSNINYLENEFVNINRTIDLFDKLMKEDDISFDEYINIINKIYNVEITDTDLMRISSCILGSNCKTTILDTDILYEVTKRNQFSNYFEYMEEMHKLYIKVAYTDSLNDIDRKYSYDEILKLSSDNKIVILEFILDDESDCYEEVTKYSALSTLKDFISSFNSLKYFRKEYKPLIYKFLKEYFSIYKLKNDFELYMNDIKIKLDSLENNFCNSKKINYSKNINLDNIYFECKKIRQRKISKD